MNLESIWHDVECGSYLADLGLWLSLAAEHGDPVLDVGAGTGRVTLALARAGHTVTALDHDGRLLDDLAERARGLSVSTVQADARSFQLDQRFGLIIAPMQTIQLLGGAAGRRGFLRCAVTHLREGALLATALTERFDLYSPEPGEPRLTPDALPINGTIYSSRPVAVRERNGEIMIERRREVIRAGGEPQVSDDVIRMDCLTAGQLEQEAVAWGLVPVGLETVPRTADHVGSVVVMLSA